MLLFKRHIIGILLKILVACLIVMCPVAKAGVVVIANANINIENVPSSAIVNIFLGKSNTLPNGLKVTPIDQEEGEDSRSKFYKKLVKKDASQLNAYWSRLIFTGKGQPPKAVLDDDEVIELVSTDDSLIGYISSESVSEEVNVILEIP